MKVRRCSRCGFQVEAPRKRSDCCSRCGGSQFGKSEHVYENIEFTEGHRSKDDDELDERLYG